MQTTIINHNQQQRRGHMTPNYHVYMVRMWTESPQDPNSVRLSAENTRTGQRAGFTSWEKLIEFMQRQTKDTV